MGGHVSGKGYGSLPFVQELPPGLLSGFLLMSFMFQVTVDMLQIPVWLQKLNKLLLILNWGVMLTFYCAGPMSNFEEELKKNLKDSLSVSG